MSDLTIFFTGCLVSLVILAAVGLLFWGAAHEERGTLLPESWTRGAPDPEPAPGEPESADDAERKRLVG